MQGSIQKNPQNSHDHCDEPPWKMLFGNFCCSRAKHELSVPSTKLKIKQSPLPKNLQSSWELRLIHRRNHETLENGIKLSSGSEQRERPDCTPPSRDSLEAEGLCFLQPSLGTTWKELFSTSCKGTENPTILYMRFGNQRLLSLE